MHGASHIYGAWGTKEVGVWSDYMVAGSHKGGPSFMGGGSSPL